MMLPVPPVGKQMPSAHLISVVLPAPLGPRRPKISPRPTESETDCSAWTAFVPEPNVLTSEDVVRAASIQMKFMRRPSGRMRNDELKFTIKSFRVSIIYECHKDFTRTES